MCAGSSWRARASCRDGGAGAVRKLVIYYYWQPPQLLLFQSKKYGIHTFLNVPILFQLPRCSSPEEPPFHMQHFKLPHMLALQGDDDPQQA